MVKRTSNKKNKKAGVIIASPPIKNVQHVDENHNSIISYQSINNIAQKMIDGSVKVIDFASAPYFNGLMGLLGSHYTMKIKVMKENKEEETIYAFIKTIPYEDHIRSQYILKEGLFTKELEFYNVICPFLYAYHKGDRWSPQNYPINEEVIVLEDLHIKGYRMYPNWINDVKVMKAALSALARFHACSILAEAYYARKDAKAHNLKDLFANTLRETAFTENSINQEWITRSIQLACNLYCHFTNSEQPMEMYGIMCRIFTTIQPNLTHRNVICHGDLWWNNMLFNSTKESTKCVFVDFQMIRYGPQVHDILQLMYLHSTRDWRQLHEREMLAHYHAVLNETLAASSLSNFTTVQSYDDLEYSYNDLRIYGLVMACLYLPFTLMDADFLNDCAKDRQKAAGFTWGNRFEITKTYLAQNKEASKLIKDVLLETCDHCDLIYNYEMYRDLTVMEKFKGEGE